jgi:hypothetical protein
MEDLINSMTLEDPTRRPLIEKVLEEFYNIRSTLNQTKLGSRIKSRRLLKFFDVPQLASQCFRTAQSFVLCQTATPT